MRFQRIKEEVLYKPWLITAAGHKLIIDLLESHGALLAQDEKCGEWKPKRSYDEDKKSPDDKCGKPRPYSDGEEPEEPEGPECEESLLFPSRPSLKIDFNGVAHISVMGVLGRKLGLIEKACGNTDYKDIEKDVMYALQNNAKAFMFHIDSPGGTVSGNAELVDIIQGIQLPKIAWVDCQASSAAYNIACSTNAIYCTKSGMVGSIGTLIPWVDKSKMWAEEGLMWDPITNMAGDLKATGHGPSLTEDQRSVLQQLAEDSFTDFKNNVLRNRRVPESAMRGQAFYAARGLENNLIDGIATESEVYEMLIDMI